LADSTPSTTTEAAAAPAGPSNLRLRIIYGLIGAAMLLGSVWFSPWTFGIFFAFVQAVMLWEFYRMMRAGGYAPAAFVGMLASLWLFAAFFFTFLFSKYSGGIQSTVNQYAVNGVGILLLLLTTILLLREIAVWSGESGKVAPFASIGVNLLGIFYVGLPMSMLNVIAFHKQNSYGFQVTGYDYRRIFALLFLVWASDIGAYAAGKTFGKHKMAPKISPGKTWEGWAGGFVLTLLVGWALSFMLPDMPLAHRLVAAGVVAVFAPLGDLAESMLKRSVGVKDSGSIMPGHGGLLDRFDAFLLVLPVLALLQLLAG
jgi:phosphatidate cytidylyltransferase